MGGCSLTLVKLILRQTMINLAGMQQVRLLVTTWIRNSVLSFFFLLHVFDVFIISVFTKCVIDSWNLEKEQTTMIKKLFFYRHVFTLTLQAKYK